MKTIKELIKTKEPFAVVQHFEWLKSSKSEKNKVFELLTLNVKKPKGVEFSELKKEDLYDFKTNVSLLTLKHKTKDGSVYEFMNFKTTLKHLL